MVTRIPFSAAATPERQPQPPAAYGQAKTNRLFQTSTMAALLDGVYDGDITVGELLQRGTFGLGTFNALDGEMIVNEGVVHQLRAEGRAGIVPNTLRTPFACVTDFEPEQRFRIESAIDKAGFEGVIEEKVGNPNLLVAVRFTGILEEVNTRTVFCQCHPYPKMLDVVAKQPTIRFGATRGTMLGFRTPGYMQGLNVAGYHLHFLDHEKRRGGHVTDYRLLSGEVEFAVISDVELQLPRTEAFAAADLSPGNINEAIHTAEGE
jgi:acetolactate decarboxylase